MTGLSGSVQKTRKPIYLHLYDAGISAEVRHAYTCKRVGGMYA